jgi:hypothetical protein
MLIIALQIISLHVILVSGFNVIHHSSFVNSLRRSQSIKLTSSTNTILNENVTFPKTEIMSRIYVPDDPDMPCLSDCNNYYSGKFGDLSWHQNADQVLVTLKLPKTISKSDIKVKFDTTTLDIMIPNIENVSVTLPQKIIPAGTFWTLEDHKNNNSKYLVVDMEKRYRVLNWGYLFGSPPTEKELESKRAEILEKLYAANKGLSRLSGDGAGKEIETIDDMRRDEVLMSSIDTNFHKEGPILNLEDLVPIDQNTSISEYEDIRRELSSEHITEVNEQDLAREDEED